MSDVSLPVSSSGAEYNLEPTKEFTPPPERAAGTAPVEKPPAPKSPPPAPPSREPRRVDVDADPQLASSSPLAAIPILTPPSDAAPRPKPATVRDSPPSKPAAPRPSLAESDWSDERPVSEPTASLLGPMPPLGPPAPSGRETTEEAKARMHRAELRTRVNLAIFVIGTLVMVAFAWIVIRFSKPG
jgi:hypothetical protein